MAPRKNAKKRDARPKRAEQTKAAGHEKEKNKKTGACAGVSCYYLNCISEKRKKNKKKTENDDDDDDENLRKRERAQKKPDLTSIEFFQTVSGAKRQKIKQKQ